MLMPSAPIRHRPRHRSNLDHRWYWLCHHSISYDTNIDQLLQGSFKPFIIEVEMWTFAYILVQS